jgi:hypothetical protein
MAVETQGDFTHPPQRRLAYPLFSLFLIIFELLGEGCVPAIHQADARYSNTLNVNQLHMQHPLDLSTKLSGHASEGTLRFHLYAENISADTLYIFDSARMPYLILEADGSLFVLHGVNAPDPDIDYPLIEIPVTQALAPGGKWEATVALVPLMLADHYAQERKATVLQGHVQLHAHVAWGRTPILPDDRHRLSIQALLDWQQWAMAAPLPASF